MCDCAVIYKWNKSFKIILYVQDVVFIYNCGNNMCKDRDLVYLIHV